MRASTEPGARRKVLCFADTDSYIKWAAHLLETVPATWERQLVIVRSTAMPSKRQLAEVLAGTLWQYEDIPVVGISEMRALVHDGQPDVVVAAARGFVVAAYLDALCHGFTGHRPVLVSGLPGISLPALSSGVRSRRACDVFVLHAKAEVLAYRDLIDRCGIPNTEVGLATLPFLTDRRPSSGPRHAKRDSIVFATQAKVPRIKRERMHIVEALVATAKAHPELRVVVKIRALKGEAQTHAERYSYPLLLEEYESFNGVEVPDNLVVEGGSMADQLERAVGLVTVSSTALIEAAAQDVPVLALDDFGVRSGLINVSLVESDTLGSTADLVALNFRMPRPSWMDSHYFHTPEDNTWWSIVQQLLVQRDRNGLPQIATRKSGLLPALRMRFYHYEAFVPERITVGYRLRGLWWKTVLWGQQKIKNAKENKVSISA